MQLGRRQSTLTIILREALGGERLWFYGQNTLLLLLVVQKQVLSLSRSRSISGSLLFSRTTAAVQNPHLFYFPLFKNQDGI